MDLVGTDYPTSIDRYNDPTLWNPVPRHDGTGEHSNAYDAIIAIEETIGVTGAFNFGTGGGGAFAGTSPQNPVWLAPVAWVYLNLPQAGFTIDPYTYDNGSLGIGATVTQNTPSDGALLIDGGTPALGDRVAFCDVAGGYPYCGVYVVTALGDGSTVPWVLTRATDNDTSASIYQYWATFTEPTGVGAVFSVGAIIQVGLFVDGATVVGTDNFDLMISGPRSYAFGQAGSSAIGTDSICYAQGSFVSGNYAFSSGTMNQQSGDWGFQAGNSLISSGDWSTNVGENNEVDGDWGVALGRDNKVSAAGGIALGGNALAWAPWYWALSNGAYSVQGGSQYAFWIPYNQTTDATPTLLGTSLDGSLAPPATFSLDFPDFIHTALLEFRVVARRTDVPGTVKVMECNNLVVDGDGVSAYRIVGTPTWTTVQEDAAASGWSAVAQLNGGNSGVEVQVTGEAGNTIQWTCTIKLYEVAG